MKWEYHTCLIADLNTYGALGWEAYAVDATRGLVWLKRQNGSVVFASPAAPQEQK